jgi:hypothetical protein
LWERELIRWRTFCPRRPTETFCVQINGHVFGVIDLRGATKAAEIEFALCQLGTEKEKGSRRAKKSPFYTPLKSDAQKRSGI